MTSELTVVDPLAETMHFMRMNSACYYHSELTAPWGMTLPATPNCLWFHAVISGRCRIEIAGSESQWLQAGDISLLVHGQGHALRNAPGVPAPPVATLDGEQVSDRYEILHHGGGGDTTVVVCGMVRFEHAAARRFIELLPRIVLVKSGETPAAESIHAFFDLMSGEARAMRPGAEAVIRRLADVLVIKTIQAWVKTESAGRTGWISALRDHQIGPALSLLHHDPTYDWTVASLAKQVAMSRSAFAGRFTAMLGEPVIQYLTRWRMYLALDSLQAEDVTVATLADRLGYRSEAAFARAFKRVIGIPPGAVRKISPVPSLDGST